MEANERKFKKLGKYSKNSIDSHINNLDDGCLMHVFSFLTPIPGCPNSFFTEVLFQTEFFLKADQTPAIGLSNDGDVEHHLIYFLLSQLDRYNTALVCHRWRFLACHPRLWLRVDRFVKDSPQPGVFPDIETAVSAARPGDTILIAAGGIHRTSNIQIKKPLCLTGAGELPDDTTLICSRDSDSALEFLSTCKLTNLTVRAELGCCLLHRSGRLTIDGCILQCESNPLDHLSHAIVTTATTPDAMSSALERSGDCVSVMRTRIEGGAKAVLTSGTLSLQQVRVIYTRTSLFFWFNVESR